MKRANVCGEEKPTPIGDGREGEIRGKEALNQFQPAFLRVRRQLYSPALEPASKRPLGDALPRRGQARPEPDKEDRHLLGEEGEILGARRQRTRAADRHGAS